MITTVEPGRYFHVAVREKHQDDAELNAAIGLAQQGAQIEGWMGVLVTRHSPGIYTVALSEDVPYGVTAEREAQD